MIFDGHGKVNEGWTIEDGYRDDIDMKTYPERTSREGLLSGINIILISSANEKDYICGDATSGYKVSYVYSVTIQSIIHIDMYVF